MPESQEVKYYVTEKNDLGVIWNVFYDWDSARNVKTEHDGYMWRRDGVQFYKEKHFHHWHSKSIRDIKLNANNAASTKYELLTQNCHKYAMDILLYL